MGGGWEHFSSWKPSLLLEMGLVPDGGVLAQRDGAKPVTLFFSADARRGPCSRLFLKTPRASPPGVGPGSAGDGGRAADVLPAAGQCRLP